MKITQITNKKVTRSAGIIEIEIPDSLKRHELSRFAVEYNTLVLNFGGKIHRCTFYPRDINRTLRSYSSISHNLWLEFAGKIDHTVSSGVAKMIVENWLVLIGVSKE
jgi:hypothetical protein